MVVTGNMRKIRKLYLLQDIKSLSDKKYQKEVWVEAKHSGVVDTWEDVVYGVIEDSDLCDMLDNNPLEHFFTIEQASSLRYFLHKLKLYIKTYGKVVQNPNELFDDPDWQAIVDEAQGVIKLFPEVKDLDRLLEEAMLAPDDD